METYLMMLYVTLDQESALKQLFDDNGWPFYLSVTTDKLGPARKFKVKRPASPVILGKRKATSSARLAPAVKLVKILAGKCGKPKEVNNLQVVSQESQTSSVNAEDEIKIKKSSNSDICDDDDDFDNKEEISDVTTEMKNRQDGESFDVADHDEQAVSQDVKDIANNDFDDDINNDLDDVGDEENDDTDDSFEGMNDEVTEEKLDGTNVSVKIEAPGPNTMEQSSMENFPSQTFDDEQDSDDGKPIESQETVVNRLLSQSQQHGQQYKCCICGKVIKIKYNMKRHLRTHLPDQIKCNLCNRFFESREKQEEHEKNRHSNRHMCETCGISFKRKSDLNSHMIKHESAFVQETSPNCFKCMHKGCGKLFFRQTNYEYHLNTHSGIKPYECSKCLKLFHSKYTKNEHEKDCLNEEGYGCEMCGSTFKQRSGLHNHMQAEHVQREKGFSCEVCSQMFKFLSGLIRHKKDKHKLSDASQQTDTTAVETMKSESAVETQAEIITPTSNTAFIVVTDIEPESKNDLESVNNADDITVNTSVVEDISEANTTEIITAMSEQQVIETGTDINIERVIVVHQVASELPQHLDDVNH
ncbi:zinc finger protein 577-like isoform X2 [Ruditapes philippinarum]|uniref:zinc finger protein 577-like isoform X2 n=1 Tax=Ruditapes philippinarum TaxID=129788 RepID=UPI00295B6634|nr:zinc finger protein 577-like isoform X2 [Ruditapes philippinarum]